MQTFTIITQRDFDEAALRNKKGLSVCRGSSGKHFQSGNENGTVKVRSYAGHAKSKGRLQREAH